MLQYIKFFKPESNKGEFRLYFELFGKSCRGHHHSEISKTNTKTLIFAIWIRPQGSQGCQNIRFFFSQIKLLSFCANIAPKRHKLQKTIKIEKKCKKNPCFLRVFRIFFNLGAILAHQTSNGKFSGPWRTFWHPRDLWGRIHIDLNKNSVWTGCVYMDSVSDIIKISWIKYG